MAVTTKIIVQQILNIDDTKATASKFPRYTVTLGNSISSITASELVSSIEAAAKSAAAAKDSEIAAKTSELNAKDSEQEAAISAGASEASATQSATSATQSAASADRSAESAAAAKVSETNAKASETKAKTSETNAKASETNAKSSETKAKASETNAKTSETNAAASAAAAKISETNAKISETNAAESAASAADSKGFRDEAEAFAAQAAASAAAAKVSETKAKTSETNAKSSETKAKASETNAASSATSASQSVTTIQGLKSDVEELKSDTQTIKNSAITETTALKNQAATSATNAAASATEAGKQATNAANSAKTAKTEADRSKTEADRAKAEADRSEAAINGTPELQPLPDVWVPLNDSLDMITGFSPSYKKIIIGDDEITMPSDKVIKFKRASTATYVDKGGMYCVAEIDEPRFERMGMLIEGQRTNLLINSTNPSKWNKSSNLELSISDTDTYGFPFGKFTVKASLIGQTSAINIVTVSGSKGFDVTGDEKYVTISCRVQSGTPNLRCRLRFENYDGSVYTFLGDAYLNLTTLQINYTGTRAEDITARATKDPGSKWIYYEATIKAQSTDSMIGAMVQYAPAEGLGTLEGDYIYVSTPQVEGGLRASSFIVTEATPATRASDIVTFPIRNNWASPALSALVEVNTNWDGGDMPNRTGAARILNVSTVGDATNVADESYMYLGFVSYGNKAIITNGKGTATEYKSDLARTGRHNVIGFIFKENRQLQVVVDGALGPVTTSPYRKQKYSDGLINIGGQSSNGSRHLFGHIRNLRIWHKALTDRQMKESI